MGSDSHFTLEIDPEQIILSQNPWQCRLNGDKGPRKPCQARNLVLMYIWASAVGVREPMPVRPSAYTIIFLFFFRLLFLFRPLILHRLLFSASGVELACSCEAGLELQIYIYNQVGRYAASPTAPLVFWDMFLFFEGATVRIELRGSLQDTYTLSVVNLQAILQAFCLYFSETGAFCDQSGKFSFSVFFFWVPRVQQ